MTGGKIESLALLGAQQGILYAQQLVPDSPIFNIGQAVWFGRGVDPALLDEAVRTAVAESEVLSRPSRGRTTARTPPPPTVSPSRCTTSATAPNRRRLRCGPCTPTWPCRES